MSARPLTDALIATRLRQLLAENVGVNIEDITLDLPLQGHLLDSLAVVEAVMTFEDDFEVEVCDEALNNCGTVRSLIEACQAVVTGAPA
jgi:acyl carrier protein